MILSYGTACRIAGETDERFGDLPEKIRKFGPDALQGQMIFGLRTFVKCAAPAFDFEA
jgi:hypothetical protein